MDNKILLIPDTFDNDASCVYGVANHDSRAERAMERKLHRYFDQHKNIEFFGCNEEELLDIFQNAFIVLWENIENRKIYADSHGLYNAAGEPFTSSLTTYFMAIAKNKYREHARRKTDDTDYEEAEKAGRALSDTAEGIDYMEDAISDCLSVMSERCCQVLTMFYYEDKSLDEILLELPSFESKNALKTTKYKCMETLRKNAQELYRQRVNSNL